MKKLKVHKTLKKTEEIVSFQQDLGSFYSKSKNTYYHFRIGKAENHPILNNIFVRLSDLAISYLIYPFFLLDLRADVIEVNSGLDKKSFYRDWLDFKIPHLILSKSRIFLYMDGWDEEFEKKIVIGKLKSFLNFFNSTDSIVVLG